MEGIKRTIKWTQEKREKLAITAAILSSFPLEDTVPGTIGLTIVEGVWIDLIGTDEWKAFRQAMGNKILVKYDQRLKRNDKGQIRVSYFVSDKPFTEEDAKKAEGYSSVEGAGLNENERLVTDLVICISPGNDCEKIFKGQETTDVYEWVCNEEEQSA